MDQKKDLNELIRLCALIKQQLEQVRVYLELFDYETATSWLKFADYAFDKAAALSIRLKHGPIKSKKEALVTTRNITTLLGHIEGARAVIKANIKK